MHVLRFHRDMPGYQAAQARREWRRTTIMRPEQRRVGFLGFGMMAKAPALVLRSLGFQVSAWVRNPRDEGDIPIYHGFDQLEMFLGQTDIAVCLLPLTKETQGLFCARTFAMMPRGAMLVNVGRGKHVVEPDLIEALDSGQLSYAALDALWPEPLPPTSPLWLHPQVTVMPHVARRPTVAQIVTEIAANIRSIQAGRHGSVGLQRRFGPARVSRRGGQAPGARTPRSAATSPRRGREADRLASSDCPATPPPRCTPRVPDRRR